MRTYGENCIFGTSNIALRSFAIPNIAYAKMRLQTCAIDFHAILCISSFSIFYVYLAGELTILLFCFFFYSEIVPADIDRP